LCLFINNVQSNVQLEMLICSLLTACSLQGILYYMEYALLIYQLKCFFGQFVNDEHYLCLRSLFAHYQRLQLHICRVWTQIVRGRLNQGKFIWLYWNSFCRCQWWWPNCISECQPNKCSVLLTETWHIMCQY